MKDISEEMMKKQMRNKTGTFVLALVLAAALLSACGGGQTTESGAETPKPGGSAPKDTQALAVETAKNLMEVHENPGIAFVGGEWLIIGLLHSGAEVPDAYYDHYYDNVRAEVKSKKGVLTDDHYTEYERLIMCLTELGKDPGDVEGYDLRPYLDEYDTISEQGSNASSYALVASKVCGYPLKNEEKFIQLILKEAGETYAMGKEGLSDYVAMGLEALSFYAGREDVDKFIEEGVTFLSNAQREDGALNNCEATAECIFALNQLGIDPDTDERFIKNGNTLEDGLMTFYLGKGEFFHDADLKEADPLSAEKALLALDTLMLGRNGGKLFEAK